MIPLYDESAPSNRLPYLTLFLIAVNLVVFLFTYFNPNFNLIVQQYGDIPSRFLNGEYWALVTLFTSMFLHASFWHLLGNMWFLWLFGDNIEHYLGKFKYLFFYIFCGIVASLANIMLSLAYSQNLPTIGASGAISGLMGGYIVLFPRNKIKAFFLVFITPLFFSIPAIVYIGLWFLGELFLIGSSSMVAYWAHIGGFISGLLLMSILKRNVEA